ncbi:MAG TPA: AtzH-like domain-containing protein [Longimicrobiales bacterium]|nr:AtzH-like domain-containing protein [Longimicrobiales bacterium]
MTHVSRLALVAFVAAACAAPEAPPFTDADKAAIADSIEAAMHSYDAAIKALDVGGVWAHYTASPDFRFIENEAVYSLEELRPVVEGLRSLRSYEGGFGEIHVNVLGREAALADAPFIDVFTDSAGVVARVRGTVTWVWIRTPEGWRITHGQAYAVPDTTKGG